MTLTVEQESSHGPRHNSARAAPADDLQFRLVDCLCLALRGRSDALDRVLGRLAKAIRTDTRAGELEALVQQIAAGVRKLPAQPDAAAAAASSPAIDRRIVAPALLDTFADTLSRIELTPDLQPRVAQAITILRSPVGDDDLAMALAELVRAINQQRTRLLSDRADAQQLLILVNAQLDEFASFMRGQAADQKNGRDNREALDAQVMGEMTKLNDSVQTATRLDVLRKDVATRLEAVRGHLQQFRAGEEKRVETYEQNLQHMRARIGELETHTRDLERSLAAEQRAATTDALTGIPNRAAYDERIALERKTQERSGRRLCLAVWDIDRFKSINDNYGHQAGDRLLRAVAHTLSHGKRDADFLARYGGEEFVLILPDVSTHEAGKIAERLRQGIERIGFRFRDTPVPVTISCGITAVAAEETSDEAFIRADKALYEAKRNGRNCCVIA